MTTNSQSPGTQEWWEHQVDVIMKLGAYAPALLDATELLNAPQVRARALSDSASDRAIAAVQIIELALEQLGDAETNPRVRAAVRWLGISLDVRGLPLKDRRLAAASMVAVRGADGARTVAVETWRRNYEPELRRDLVWELAQRKTPRRKRFVSGEREK